MYNRSGSAAFNDALQQYNRTLSSKPLKQLSPASAEELLEQVKKMEESHRTKSRSRAIIRRIEPFLNFVNRYSETVSIAIQYNTKPAALVWGGMKILLELASSYGKYFERLLVMIEVIGDKLPLYKDYEDLFRDSDRPKRALILLYCDTIEFLGHAMKPFKSTFLRNIRAVAWKSFDQHFEEILRRVEWHDSLLRQEIQLLHMQKIHGEINAADEERNSSTRLAIMDWLSPVDSETDFIREDGKREPRTNEWLFSESSMIDWTSDTNKADTNRVVWVNGIPGCGKSILCSSAIRELRHRFPVNSHIPIAFFFCDQKDSARNKLDSILRTWISQLLSQCQYIPDSIRAAFDISRHNGRPRISPADQPIKLLRDLVERFSQCYFVLDALDECEDRREFMPVLVDMVESANNAKLLVTSRNLYDIGAIFSKHLVVEITTETVHRDVDTYLTSAVARLNFEESYQKKIHKRLLDGSGGMFLWVHLMVENLRFATSPYDIEEQLESLPTGLEGVYQKILDKLDSEGPNRRALVKKVLLWACFCDRPLEWRELRHAFSIDEEELTFNSKKTPWKTAILELGAPLVEFHGTEQTLHLTHLSVKEFLTSPQIGAGSNYIMNRHFIPTEFAHGKIAASCLAYLTASEWSSNLESTENYSFVTYAIAQWCSHLVRAASSGPLLAQTNQFLILFERVWLQTLVRLFPSALPVQKLLSWERQLNAWREKQTDADKIQFHRTDWILYIQEFIVDDALFNSPILRARSATGTENSVWDAADLSRLMILRDIARVYTQSGRLAVAEQWLDETLQKRVEIYGLGSVKTLWLMNSLAIIYDQQGRTAEAKQMHMQALEIQEDHLGPEHPATIWTVNDLGRICRHLGELSEAENMHLRALAAQEKVLPPDHPEIIWTLNTLARTYRKQKRLEKAIELHKSALKSQKLTMGCDHPHTLWTASDLGRCYRELGELELALRTQREVLERRTEALGKQHPDTLWTVNDVGIIHEQLGKLDEAILLQETALQGQEVVLGHEHEHTKWTRMTLESLRNKSVGANE
ncbi:hypothetical protein BDD12DRAFT_754871 [Trichophaea hybrida]|nr:hypothetical protein BDD12DRAFT_754871 [Trichophaea hybrida]